MPPSLTFLYLMSESHSRGVIGAILIGSLLISGALVFVGVQYKSGALDPATLEMMNKFLLSQVNGNTAPSRAAPAEEAAPSAKVKPVDLKKDHIRGNKDAEISVIEYSDFECPFCKRAHATLQQLVDDADGKVNWVYRNYPLGFHDPVATKEAMASECAAEVGGNDGFWKYADLLFARTQGNGAGLSTPDDIFTLAQEVHLNTSRFKSCVDSEVYKKKVQQDEVEGSAAGVDGTPGNFVINNKTQKSIKVSGAQPLANFQRAIDQVK